MNDHRRHELSAAYRRRREEPDMPENMTNPRRIRVGIRVLLQRMHEPTIEEDSIDRQLEARLARYLPILEDGLAVMLMRLTAIPTEADHG